MPTPTKVILAIAGLLVGVLVVYYGYMIPTSPEMTVASDPLEAKNADLDARTAEQAADLDRGIDSKPRLVPVDDGATKPRGLFSSALPNGGLDSVSAPVANAAADLSSSQTGTTSVINDPTAGAASQTRSEPPTLLARDTPATPDVKPAIPVDYTIRSGDTLIGIAAQLLGNPNRWQQIVQANPGLDPQRLRIGQRIKLPSRDARSPVPVAPASQSQVYTVRPGDTLSGLAQHFYRNGGLWERIFVANRLTLDGDPNALQVGMKLVIPPGP